MGESNYLSDVPTEQPYWNDVTGNMTFAEQTTQQTQLPVDMRFNDDSLIAVVAYSILFVISAFGNLSVFITLFRNGRRRSRMNKFILHLTIADLIVTFIMMPIEGRSILHCKMTRN